MKLTFARLITLGSFLLLWQACYAQEAPREKKLIITGRITDGYGRTLSGATIIIKGADKSIRRGTVSDGEGKYQIEVDSTDKVMVVSFVGFTEMEKEIKGREVVNFSMGTETIVIQGWCCTDHPKPSGPHCGDSQQQLKDKFNCKIFKRDN